MLKAARRQLNPATAMAFVAMAFAATGSALAVTSHNSEKVMLSESWVVIAP